MTNAGQSLKYAIFVSYAHSDDRDGWVTELVRSIDEEHARFSPDPLRIFFDRDEIQTMSDWEHRILNGLRDAELMLAVGSPAYFESCYCRKEWEVYIEHELDRAVPGQGIAPVYMATVPSFETESEGAKLSHWIVNLRQRQYLDLRDWRGKGSQALRNPLVRHRLELLEQSISERLSAANRVAISNTTIPPHNRKFVGRTGELRRLRAMLALGRVGAVTAVHGLGGIGKSALAFEYAHAYAGDYPGGRFLVPAAGVRDLRVPIVALATYKGVNLTDDERKDLDTAFARVRAAFELGLRSLLVLDNVDNPKLLAPSERARCLPASDNVHVLVTTRLDPERLPELECLPLDALPQEDAIRLLGKHRPLANEADEQAAHDIARRLEGFPLAVEVVGVFLWQHPEVSYSSYLIRLEQKGLNALEESARDDLVELSRHREKLLRVLIEPTLSSLSPTELLLLEYASLLPPEQIALPWMRELVGQQHPEVAIEPEPGYPDTWIQLERRLFGLRLLMPSEERHVACMHRLIQDVVKADTSPERLNEQREALAKLALDRSHFLSEAWIEPGKRWEMEPLLWYTTAALESDNIIMVSNLASSVQKSLWKSGRHQEARDLVRRAIAVQEKSRASDELSLARDYSNLAAIECDFGDFQSAHDHLLHAIAIEERRLSPHDSTLAVRYCNLGAVDLLLNRTDAARKHLRRAIEVYEEAVNCDSTLALFYVDLAAVENTAGNYVEAARLLKHAISMEQRILTPNDPDLARHQADLGMVELSLGHASIARDLLRQALPILEKSLPPDHTSLATVRSYLATVEMQVGNLEVAWKLLDQTVVPLEQANHPDLVIRLFDLGHLARRMGNLDAAQTLLRRCLALVGSPHYLRPDTHIAALALLAVVERDLANLEKARELIHQAISILDQSSLNDCLSLAVIYSNLAFAARDALSPSEAHQLLEVALQLAHAHVPIIHNINEGQLYSNLGLAARDLGDRETARELLRQAVTFLEKTADPENDLLALSRYRLGLVEYDLGNLREAEALIQHAYRVQLLKLSTEHPATQNTARWLAAHGRHVPKLPP